eukprot:364937-Chlamydomonas_euryale.AAC.18
MLQGVESGAKVWRLRMGSVAHSQGRVWHAYERSVDAFKGSVTRCHGKCGTLTREAAAARSV